MNIFLILWILKSVITTIRLAEKYDAAAVDFVKCLAVPRFSLFFRTVERLESIICI
jgi:hypothetical protein